MDLIFCNRERFLVRYFHGLLPKSDPEHIFIYLIFFYVVQEISWLVGSMDNCIILINISNMFALRNRSEHYGPLERDQ